LSNTSNVRAVVGISKKFDLDKEKLTQFAYGRKAGEDEEKLIAELIGMPKGKDHKDFLQERLTKDELETLKNILSNLISNR